MNERGDLTDAYLAALRDASKLQGQLIADLIATLAVRVDALEHRCQNDPPLEFSVLEEDASPTAQQVYDRLREEWDALGLLSYHGGVDGAPWMADLTKDDIDRLRGLLRDAAATIEAYS